MKDIIACICEGGFEKAILDRLLENDCLIFSKSQLLDQDLLDGYYRSGKKFERDYLNKDFEGSKIIIYRIIDSRKEALNFKLSKKYRDKIKLISAITHPEIEMLYIISEGKISEYNKKYKSNLKPSIFVKMILKEENIKSYKFVYNYFNDIKKLIKVLKVYARHKENTIYDLLKEEYK